MKFSQHMRLVLAPAAGLLLAASAASAQYYGEEQQEMPASMSEHSSSSSMQISSEEGQRVTDAAAVLHNLLDAPDAGIARSILDRTEAVIVFPKLVRTGMAAGIDYGHGVMSVRDGNSWSAPAFVKIAGGTLGPEPGVEATELVLFFTNRDAVDDLLRNGITLGGGAWVEAGPVGRQASMAEDLSMLAKILAYSRSKGIYAGATIQGASLKSDDEASAGFYGRDLSAQGITTGMELGSMPVPEVARSFDNALREISSGARAD